MYYDAEFLDDRLDVPLSKEDKEDLIKLVDVRVNGKVKKSIEAINRGLAEKRLPYVVVNARTKEKRYWIVHKVG